jgi:hypothetical protein
MRDMFRIEPKKTIDIAREWLIVKGPAIVMNPRDEMLSEFADLLTKQVQFERDTFKKLAEDAIACHLPQPILIPAETLNLGQAMRALAIVEKMAAAPSPIDDCGYCLWCNGCGSKAEEHDSDCTYRLAVELIAERKVTA